MHAKCVIEISGEGVENCCILALYAKNKSGEVITSTKDKKIL